jgi:uncharacterized protein (TIGR03437 family)
MLSGSVTKSFRRLLLLGVFACAVFGGTPAFAQRPDIFQPIEIDKPEPVNVLIVAGTDPLAITAANVLNSDLLSDDEEDFVVTIVNTGVPVSLAGYTQIFDVRYNDLPDFTAGEMNQYLAFLNAAPGNALFLMGENGTYNERNIPVNNFITLAGGGVIAPPTGYVFGPETVHPPFTGPHHFIGVSAVTYYFCGLVTSSGTGAFATTEEGGGCAIFFVPGTLANAPHGALVVVYDVNFIATAPTSFGPFHAINEIPFRLNLEQFVSAPPAPPKVTPAPAPFQISYVAPVSLQVVPNESLLASGAINVFANQTAPFAATTTAPWLTLTKMSATLPGTIDMTANAAGLAPGSYQGTVVVTAEGSTISVQVTFTVLLPASITASPASLPGPFGYPLGSATGYDVQIGAAGTYTAQTSADSSSWLTVSPTSGSTPATLHVVIDPSQAVYGTYQDAIVITSPGAPNSPLAIPVRMTLSSLISQLPQEVNAATGAGADATVAPNEIVSLFLTDFSCAAQPVVSLNGAAVAWSVYVPGQINYAVPEGITQPAILSVACNGATVWNFNSLSVAATMPGIFAAGTVSGGQAAVVNADGTVNGGSNAARRGSFVSVYVTGFGVFDADSPDGLRSLAGTVLAQIGGVPATVRYSGESPGHTDGLQQINLLVPANSPVGAAVPVMLWVNGAPTQTTTTIAVQ